ncbi:MAG TPA: nuclear transport factor 2 family protein [Gemmatimonadaceae bacterium]|nr:nuclear transport factor 2 family protein [Gemmatimonadaceae bacterium]
MTGDVPHSPLLGWWPALLAGDVSALRALFTGEPLVDDPLAGRVEGRAAVDAYIASMRRWLAEHDARPHPVASTVTTRRAVDEVELKLLSGGAQVALPVAVVADLDQDRVRAVRVYHSLWPLGGRHAVRAPLLATRAYVLPEPVASYQHALAAGDVEAVVATFEPDGVAREPSGGQYTHRGADALRAYYASLFAAGGGIPLGHCTVTDDGVRCAVEYVVTRWGAHDLPAQAGVAVYERGTSGLLRAARVYDDVEAPGGA